MDTVVTIDLAELFTKEPFDKEALALLKESAFESTDSMNRFLELLAGLEEQARSGATRDKSATFKLGVCYLALGDSERAVAYLGKAEGNGEAEYYMGQALRDLCRHKDAMAAFDKAAQKGYDALSCQLQRAECLVLCDDLDGAERIVSAAASSGQSSAVYHYAKGRILEGRGILEKALEEYEAAVNLDNSYPAAMFRLAYLLDLHGSDDRALELYIQCSELPFVSANVLINLAVIFEDEGEYDKASSCLHRVLMVNPNHPRALLFYKDVLASQNMFIDEIQLRAKEEHDAVLDIPVTDFELSVRSRNCLKKMNIHTLGDLLRITEQELLAYKNFGETSLREIKAMLAQKGLSLGMNAPKTSGMRHTPAPVSFSAPVEAAVETAPDLVDRSVAAIELSVRSRKCLQRLGINTIGELVSRSESELLESRNFGLTSLKEIKERLLEMGLSLRA